MLRRPPRSTRTDTLFPTRRSSDLVTPLSARAIVKPTLIVILLIASVCSYFMSTFGVVIDKAMIANALQTDARETGELLGFPMLLHVLWAGVIPAVLVARVQIVSSSSEGHTFELQSLMRISY